MARRRPELRWLICIVVVAAAAIAAGAAGVWHKDRADAVRIAVFEYQLSHVSGVCFLSIGDGPGADPNRGFLPASNTSERG